MRPFVDSNVLLYLISTDARKAQRAEALLADRVVVSVQVLNEFANVARRKRSAPWQAVRGSLKVILRFADVRPLDLDTHLDAIRLAERYRLSCYDAVIVASALQAGCATLMSEDFQAGQHFDGALRVVNPFADCHG